MASRAPAASLPGGSDKPIRDELARILGSATFQPVDRLKRFLTFIAQEALAGRSDQLKEYVIGVQVFGKEASFDPRTDPIVRVQARRLRARLVRYYREQGQHDEIVVELPKGGYAPVFKRRDPGAAPRRSIAAALANRNTIAVLPFADHSPAGDLEYFCRGLREEIVHALARSDRLRVLAWDRADLTGAADLRDADAKFDAAMIVTGSVRRSGDTVRVSMQVVDGASGCYLWSDSLNGDINDAFAAQEEAARAVTARLRPEMLGGVGAARGRPTENLAAHNLYLQGRYHLNQRTEEGLR